MSNIQPDDYKPPSSRVNPLPVLGFQDDKAITDVNDGQTNQKDLKTSQSKQVDKSMNVSNEHVQIKRLGEVERGPMPDKEVNNLKSETKAIDATASEQEIDPDHDQKINQAYKDDSNRRDDGSHYSKHAQRNNTQYNQQINSIQQGSEKHDNRSYSVKRSQSKQGIRFDENLNYNESRSPLNMNFNKSLQRSRNGDIEMKDDDLQDASGQIEQEKFSGSKLKEPNIQDSSLQRCQSQSSLPHQHKMSSSLQIKELPSNKSHYQHKERKTSVTAQNFLNNDRKIDNIQHCQQTKQDFDNKQTIKRMYLSKKCKEGFNSKIEGAIIKQFMSIEKFLDVSKVLLNKFVCFQDHIKQEYLNLIHINMDKLYDKLEQSEQSFAQETFYMFSLVLKVQMLGHYSYQDFIDAQDKKKQDQNKEKLDEEMKDQEEKSLEIGQEPQNSEFQSDFKIGYNFSSFKHCIKRIHKACQIQMEDFQWDNGPYSERAQRNSSSKGKQSESDILPNPDVIKQQTSLLRELIQVEQVCKLYIDLFKRNFIQLFEYAKAEVVSLFTIDGSLKGKNNFQQNYIRFNSYNQINELLKVKEDDPAKNINLSLLNIFNGTELKLIDSSNLMLISLMEIGNTIDGVTIASKTLKQIRERHDLNQNLDRNFSRFFNWKKRKCHCCMEYILDAGKAITCFNLTTQENPCMNVYCQNCIISFMEEKHQFEEQEPDEKKPNNQDETTQKLTEEEIKKNKEMEARKTKRKLWLKASQNVLFTCPCCQSYCLEEDLQQNKKTFSQFSMCNFKYKLENHPRSFLRKEIYMYQKVGVKKLFYLCKINGVRKHKTLHLVEILQKSQTIPMKLSREEFFFTCTVKPDSKMLKIMHQQGFELDFKKQMDKYIKDFQDHNTYPLLEKYKNYLENLEINKNEFVVPKFVQYQHNTRKTFIEKHRDLYRRFENQLFEKLELPCEDVLACIVSDSENDESKQIEHKIPISQKNQQKLTSSNEKESEANQNSNSQKASIKSALNAISYKEDSKTHNQNSGDQSRCDQNEKIEDDIKSKTQTLRNQTDQQIGQQKVIEKKFLVEKAEYNDEPMRPLSIDQPVETPQEDSLIIEKEMKPVTPKKLGSNTYKEAIIATKIENKPKQSVSICKLTDDELKNFKINERQIKQIIPDVCPTGENIGNLIVREKNIMLAKEHNIELGDKFLLLITKEVFILEKEAQRIQLPFQQTYIFNNIPNEGLTYKWPFSIDEKSDGMNTVNKEDKIVSQSNINDLKELKDPREKTITFRIKELVPSDDEGNLASLKLDQPNNNQQTYKTLDMKPMTDEQKAAYLQSKNTNHSRFNRSQNNTGMTHNSGFNFNQKDKTSQIKPRIQENQQKQIQKFQDDQKIIAQGMPSLKKLNEVQPQIQIKDNMDVNMQDDQNVQMQYMSENKIYLHKKQDLNDYGNDLRDNNNDEQIQVQNDDNQQIVLNQDQQLNNQIIPFEEDEAYIEYLRELQQDDRKEYNLRKNVNTRQFHSFNERALQKRQNMPLSLRNQLPAAKEGFFDDFPPSILKEYGMKVPSKAKDNKSKRQKVQESSDNKKNIVMTIDQGFSPDLPGNQYASQQDQSEPMIDSNEQKESPNKENSQNLNYIPQLRQQKQQETQNDELSENQENQPNDQQAQKIVVEPNSISNASVNNPSGNLNESSKKDTDLSTKKLKKDSFNCKHFIVTEKLQEHYKHVLKIVEESPEKMEFLYLFVLFKKKQIWNRVQILNYIPPKDDDKDKRLFNAIIQEVEKRKVQINLLKSMFIIDCRYGDQNDDIKKDGNSTLNTEIMYNNKLRVQKLLKKRIEKQLSDSKKEINTVISEFQKQQKAIIESSQPNKVENQTITSQILPNQQVLTRDNIQEVQVKQEPNSSRFQRALEMNQAMCMELNIKSEDPQDNAILSKAQRENSNKPITPIKNESSVASSEQIKISDIVTKRTHINESNKKYRADDKERGTPVINQSLFSHQDQKNGNDDQIISSNTDPKPQWVKHMKLQILTKSRENVQKTLKFYHQEINDQEFSSADGDDQIQQQVSHQNQVNGNLDEQNIDQTQKIQDLMSQIQQKQFKNSELELQLNFNQELQKLQDQQQLNLQLRTQQMVQQQHEMFYQGQFFLQNLDLYQINPILFQQDIAQQLQNSTIEQKKLILQNLENENLIIEKKKNQLFLEIQNMKFLSDNLQLDPYEVQVKIDEKQIHISKLIIMQQLLEQIYRHQTQQIMLNQNHPYDQEVMAFQTEQINDVQNQQLLIDNEEQQMIIDNENHQQQDMQPPQAIYEEEAKQDNKQNQNVQDSIAPNVNQQSNQISNQVANIQNQQNQFPQEHHENYQNTYDHQSDQFAINEANMEYMRNMQSQFIPQQQVAFYLIPQGHQMQQQNQLNIQQQQNQERADNMFVFDNQDEEPFQCEQYLQQVQKILIKIENLDENWEQLLNDTNTFTIIERGILLLELGHQFEKNVEDEVIKQMNIQNQLQDVDLLESDIDLAMLIENDMTNYEQLQFLLDDNEKVIPDFFINHIQQLASLKKYMFGNNSDPNSQLTQFQQVVDGNNINNIQNISQLQQPLPNLTKQHLFGIMMKFYHKMIIKRGFKKCLCNVCLKMVYPMLVKFNADCTSFAKTHLMMQKQFKTLLNERDQTQPITVQTMLHMLFTEEKSNEVEQQEERYIQYKIVQNEIKPSSESQEFDNYYPCFRALIERQKEEAIKNISMENSDYEYSKLPKMSTVLKADQESMKLGTDNQDPRIQAFKNTHKQLKENIKNFLEYYNIYRK